MRTWRLLPQTTPIPPSLLHAAGGRPHLARILLQRGLVDPAHVRAFLDPDGYTPAPPEAMPGLVAGVERIETAIRRGERILIWGDFDVDGQTSTALFVSALEALGALVLYHIPVRARESHGVRPDVLRTYIDAGFELLVTCDTGIAAADAVAMANAAGVEVIITDHHDLPAVLPEALALVNPKFLPPEHPLAALPGVGVVFKVVEALFTRAGRADEVEAYLDLVALGIVADLATQVNDTRYLLQRGLSVLRRTERVGLKAIMERAGIQASVLTEEDIGFGIGPRLNAVGRLADANVAVPLLTTKDRALAGQIAGELERLNEERKLLTDQVYGAAREQVDKDPTLAQYAALVLAHPHWHQGVIGIVASRLVEEYGKPVILLASPEGEPARGSARSVDGYNVTEAIATQTAMLHGFGGHPMAAGLAIDADRIDRFRVGVSTALSTQRDGAPPDPVLEIALKVDMDALTTDLAEELQAAAPFGPGNPPVNILCTGLEPLSVRTLGKTARHRKVTLKGRSEAECEVLWWNSADERAPEGALDLVLRARVGYFRGRGSLTLTWQEHREAGGEAPRMAVEGLRIEDLRGSTDPERQLTEVVNRYPDAQVWGEVGPVWPGMVGRHLLKPSPVLVIWTCPPHQQVVDEVLARVRPETVVVFGREPALERVAAFQRRLAGVAKYALEEFQGETELEVISAAMAGTDIAVLEGLKSLASLGLAVETMSGGHVRLWKTAPGAQSKGDTLGLLLGEAAAYRRLFCRVSSLTPLLDRRV
ncbi:MAG: single-stranded-DNA-specific exonuclease RecJ [Rhodothermales bacterium]|nr:single-stranded-DNA-specific exonuclease RecJ [Rhodothermales bacterium]